MDEATVGVGSAKTPLAIRINGDRPTFRIGTEAIAAKLLAPINPLLDDLLVIACTVFAADSSIARGGTTRPDMGDAWRRTFQFKIPVSDPDYWSESARIGALADAVSFLTDDDVSFTFSPRGDSSPRQQFLAFDPSANAFAADEVILFSGGLDSFSGALEALSTTSGRVALVSHRSAQKVIPRQDYLAKYLMKRFPGRVLHIPVRATRVGKEASESTQRSRSLLFAALGQVIAQMLGAQHVSFYENGIVSHNLPISPQVIGTMATRTTHPLSLTKLNALMGVIGSNAVATRNPFQWLTKTEVVSKIAEYGAETCIKEAVSCTSVRDQDTLHTHCGACSQCLDRRFAVLAAGLEGHEYDVMYQTDVLIGPRLTDRSRTIALDWTSHAVRMHDLSLRDFMANYAMEIARIIRGQPDQPSLDTVHRAYAMHRRHSGSVINGIETAISANAGAIARKTLPFTSLIAMHSGGGGKAVLMLAEKPECKPELIVIASEVVDEDFGRADGVDAPLEVAFFFEGTRQVLVVRGLGRVHGRPAEVANALKMVYEADRLAGLARSNHSYSSAGVLSQEMGTSKSAVAKYVDRCRGSLADYYLAINGLLPRHPLLIETKKPNGYRLDPDIRVISQDQLPGH